MLSGEKSWLVYLVIGSFHAPGPYFVRLWSLINLMESCT